MRADKDDRWLQEQPNTKRSFSAVFLCLAVIVSLAVAFKFRADIARYFEHIQNSFFETSTASEPVYLTPTELARELPEAPREDVLKPSPRVRQTEFNDDNYVPRGAINSMPPPSKMTTEPKRFQPSSRPHTQEYFSKWIRGWDGGTRYLARWVVVDNRIKSTSVCENHRRGSIEYRECRKAAKQHYHEACRKWRERYAHDKAHASHRMRERYCSGANSFNPMG